MKNLLSSIITSTLFVAFAAAQPPQHYLITDLGPAGSPFSQATAINNGGVVTGLAVGDAGNQHAVVWFGRETIDLSKPGLGGPNSGAFGVTPQGAVLIQTESSVSDPNNENFCGYGTGLKCLPALWQNGTVTALSLLGGNNGTVGGINSVGEAVGAAETGRHDADCPSTPYVNGNGPQTLDFEPVIWGPRKGEIHQLRLLGGDTVGMAMAINDMGQAVGFSGLCSNTILPGFVAAPHAVLWESNGRVVDLGNLGGTVNPAVLAAGNAAMAINNRGEVVGTSSLADNITHHPFLWTSQTGMRDLGVLDGDAIGVAAGINNQGDIVGASVTAGGPLAGSVRAALWRNGDKFDLNALALPNAPLYLLTAFGINDRGEIVGFGADATGNLHGFLATPARTLAFAAPKSLTVMDKSIQLDATQSTSEDGKPLVYVWTNAHGNPPAEIVGDTTANPVVTFSRKGEYRFQLTVTDSTGGTSTDFTTVRYE